LKQPPHASQDGETLTCAETWKQILEWDIEWFYPAHGKRVGMDQLKKEARRKNILKPL